MSLEFIIKQIVLEKGQDFLTNKYFLNYISDYDNKVFNPPALKKPSLKQLSMMVMRTNYYRLGRTMFKSQLTL